MSAEGAGPGVAALGTLVGATGSLAYIRETVRGRVRPNRVAYLLWSLSPLVVFAAQMDARVGPASMMTLSVGVLPLLTLLASFTNPQAKWRLTRFDVGCGAFSLIALALWAGTGQGEAAITLSIGADGLAAVPVVVKSYRYPDTELAWPCLAGAVGVLLTLLTVGRWTYTAGGFLIYLLMVNLVLFTLVQFRVGQVLRRQRVPGMSRGTQDARGGAVHVTVGTDGLRSSGCRSPGHDRADVALTSGGPVTASR